MSWMYQGRDFTNSMIPEGAVGFVYEMEAIIVKLSARNGYLEEKVKTYREKLNATS